MTDTTAQAELAAVLDTGLRWLYETEQPGEAHQQHHGITLGLPAANRYYGFCPRGAQQLPVVSVNVAKIEMTWDEDRIHRVPSNPLELGELEALAAELEQRAYTVASTWNGHPAVTGSVGLAQGAHPTLTAAVERYLKGCVVHPERSVFCDCEAWRAEGARIVRPPLPTPASC